MNGPNGYKKEEIKSHMCKSHSARTERDIYRVCPSKLSKKELEDLYYTLLDKNLELKKTVTAQQDQIKVLSTKLQRMTATQKNNVAKEKDCCTYTKSLVNEQKENIADLKKANERMSDRIRVLNVRLCSAKQFMRPSPVTSTSRCTKCSAPPASLKNSSVTVLHTKMSDSNPTTAVSGQGLDKDVMLSTRTVETETDHPEKDNLEKLCNENRCRSLMEELKQKIVDLQEELSKTHGEYSTRITRLETEVSELRTTNDRERTERATSDHQLQIRDQQADQLATRLRDAEAKYGELSTELSIEKRKVAELETRVKAADRASSVSKTLQEHFSNNNQKKTELEIPQSETAGSPSFSPRWDKSSSPRDIPCEALCGPSEATDKPCTDKDESTEKAQHRQSKLSNDSGYIEAYKSPKVEQKDATEELTNRIVQLQLQMNELLSAIKSNPTAKALKEDDVAEFSRTVPLQKENEAERGAERESEIEKTLERATVLKPECCRKDMMTFLDEASTTSQAANVELNKAERESFAKRSMSKNDAHNRLQIPGPLPVDGTYEPPDKMLDKFSNKYNTVKCAIHGRDSEITKESEVNKLEPFSAKNNNAVERPLRIIDKCAIHGRDSEITRESEVSAKNINVVEKPLRIIDGVEKKPTSLDLKNVERDVKVRISSAQNSLESGSKAPANVGSLVEKYKENEGDKCPPSSIIVPVISEQSDDGNKIATQTGEAGSPVQEFRGRSGTFTKGQAYPIPTAAGPSAAGNVQQAETGVRAPTPDNTDHEISSLTDLPSEKDGKSPRDALSPGEEKATTTYTESYTPHTTTDYSTLSEGELPGAGGVRKDQRLSEGETKVDSKDKEAVGRQSARMEAALASITQELSLCRDLLRAQRASEDKKDESLMADLSPGPIALKRAAGSPRIGDAFTPKCIFTLHIGTVVLADEAVINSRDMSLVLTWKFYDQNVSMTRMRAGRVMLFDFSTEYDVKITDHFLNYLKHENMQLIISELDKQDEPFASCALPLRDALLHTNRRADMSLALVAGPYLRQTHDALDLGDEVGVMDLWCLLRVDPALLPIINRAIARTSPPNTSSKQPGTSPGMEQLMEDDHYNNDDDDVSRDLNIQPKLKQKSDPELPKKQGSNPKVPGDVDANNRQSKRKIELYDMLGNHRSTASQGQPEISTMPPIADVARRRSIASQISSPTGPQTPRKNSLRASFLQRNQVEFKDAETPSFRSGVIPNEVQAQNIKTASDMKQVLDCPIMFSHMKWHTNISKITRVYIVYNKFHYRINEPIDSDTHIIYMRFPIYTLPICSTVTYVKRCQMPSINLQKWQKTDTNLCHRKRPSKGVQAASPDAEEISEISRSNRLQNGSKKSVTIAKYNKKIDTCDAMVNPNVQRLYVAYTFLGRSGAELETPLSLPKPKSYVDKCYFQFSKISLIISFSNTFQPRSIPTEPWRPTAPGAHASLPLGEPHRAQAQGLRHLHRPFQLNHGDLLLLGHMARSRSANRIEHRPKDVSEPPEDPLGLDNCEDIRQTPLYSSTP
ncbi:hypothetical protein ABMA27_007122 [Loxostege sticticalis]|uniref:Uncharacterized protein n=1 Tax=Loxostege sticticalis TaxID=481309 RepID=A0ABR3ILP1_LOXSC